MSLHAIAVIAGLAGPWLLGDLVDTLHLDESKDTVDRIVITIAAAVVIQTVLIWFAYRASARLGERVLAEVREGFIDRVLTVPVSALERSSGDLTSRVSRDVDALSRCLRFAVPETIVAALTVALAVGALILVSPLLALPLLVAAPVLGLSARWYLRRAGPAYLGQNAAYSQVTDGLAETIEGVRTIDALGRQAEQARRTDANLRRSFRTEKYTLFLRTVWSPTVEIGYVLPVVGTLLIGGWYYLEGWVSLGQVIAAVLYAQLLIDPLDRFLSWLDEVQVGAASLARLLGIASDPERVPQAVGSRRSGRIVVEKVRFSYEPWREVLHGISLIIEPGERLAIVGPSGGGKSTLGRLLAGIYMPSTGIVTVDGVPLGDLPQHRLRTEIALVSQMHQIIIMGTLRENVALVRPYSTEEEVRAALAAVQALDWVDALPDGLDTEIGAGGMSLPTEQQQQVALARLVLADPHTLILDEATSLLDPFAARELEKSLAATLPGRTIVTITHRLFSAQDADRVVVVENGTITELGTHDDLIESAGSYARLWTYWHGARGRGLEVRPPDRAGDSVSPVASTDAGSGGSVSWPGPPVSGSSNRAGPSTSPTLNSPDGVVDQPTLWLPNGNSVTLGRAGAGAGAGTDIDRGLAAGILPGSSRDAPRLLMGHFPSHARLGSEISLTVRITQDSSDAQNTRAALLRPLQIGAEGVDVSVIVESGPGLTVRGPMEQVTRVPANGNSDPLRFVFRAAAVDLHRLHVTAWAGGTFLAELEFEVSVAVTGPHSAPQVKSAGIDSVRPESGEVTLQVRSDQSRITFQLLSDTRLFDPVIVESISFGPDGATEQIIQTLRNLARKTTGYTPSNVRRLMQNTGIALWNSLVPEAVREQFWQVRSSITTFSIATGLDTVPWELLYPMTKTEDEGFLIEQLPVTRRVYNQARSRRINIGSARFVVPPNGPRNAGAEIDSLHRIVSGVGDPLLITNLTDLLQLLDAGPLGLIHFACHNTYQPRAAGSSIAMGDGDFVPTLLERAKATESLAASQPLVFINACRSAGSVPHYTRMMGWAQQFLAAGAGAFVGTLWDVRSSSAQTFAEAFYGHLIAGDTLGQASLRARVAAARQGDDPTWLAYSVYGDPNAVAIQA
ncbi:hypothetical protein Aau02nite_23050 [Amorphoplanes auranticolor]|uniref:ABC-type multidrug transport system fused ATPase/permease subunit n=2 Tax=Actinoplanes auranticolor TaxID=47988 RepID=A0A919S9W9_9ACTN|nr:hypothetical protein Aau02nite_23050 [Actinoplanes auranticolor]